MRMLPRNYPYIHRPKTHSPNSTSYAVPPSMHALISLSLSARVCAVVLCACVTNNDYYIGSVRQHNLVQRMSLAGAAQCCTARAVMRYVLLQRSILCAHFPVVAHTHPLYTYYTLYICGAHGHAYAHTHTRICDACIAGRKTGHYLYLSAQQRECGRQTWGLLNYNPYMCDGSERASVVCTNIWW